MVAVDYDGLEGSTLLGYGILSNQIYVRKCTVLLVILMLHTNLLEQQRFN